MIVNNLVLEQEDGIFETVFPMHYMDQKMLSKQAYIKSNITDKIDRDIISPCRAAIRNFKGPSHISMLGPPGHVHWPYLNQHIAYRFIVR